MWCNNLNHVENYKVNMNKSLETIKNYENYLSHKSGIGLLMYGSFMLTAMPIYILISISKSPVIDNWLILIFLVVFLILWILYKLNKTYYSVDGLYPQTILKSFLHYTDAVFLTDQYICKLSRFFKLYNQSSNSKINNIILDLDNKIQLLINEDNKINGFGYVVSKECYDVIIEEINEADQEINEITKLKRLETTNHFRSIVN